MRRIEKTNKPISLAINAATWTSDLLDARKKGLPYKTIEVKYQQDDVRAALRDETSRKCAYCEAIIDAVAYDHIEHIEPKSVFVAKTFEWSNLTLACPRCNTNKGSIPPTLTNFVNPYSEDPEIIFKFIGPFMMHQPDDTRAQNMISWLDLNRTGLLEARAELVAKIQDIFEKAMILDIALRDEFVDLALAPLVRPSAKFSAAARAIIAAFRTTYV